MWKPVQILMDAVRGAKQVPDVAALAALAPLDVGYAPWSAMSIRPREMRAIVNHLLFTRPQVIVELGAGVSTLYQARVASKWGARVVSVEHDEAWRKIVGTLLEDLGLSHAVRFVDCPMTPLGGQPGAAEWYDLARLREGLAGVQIDFLLVDGPPAYQRGNALARLPALEHLRTYLAPDATVYLDDVDRAGEQFVMRKWCGDLGMAPTDAKVVGRGAFLPLVRGTPLMVG